VTTFMAGWLTVFLVGCLVVMSLGPNMAMVHKNSLVHQTSPKTSQRPRGAEIGRKGPQAICARLRGLAGERTKGGAPCPTGT